MPSAADSPRPRCAVLLAAYNGEAWLPAQLRSILDQEEVEVRVFVSVDASADGTLGLVHDWARRDPRVEVLPDGERFGGAAANFFRLFRDVDVADFDYVCLADQDDLWYADKLRRAHDALASGEAAAYSSNVLAFWPSGREQLVDKAQPQRRWDYLFEAAGPGCTYVLRAEVAGAFRALVIARWHEVSQVGLHDWFIYAFVRAAGHRWVIDHYAGLRYRQHGGNQVGVNSGGAAFGRRVRKVLSGWAIGQARLIAGLVGADREPRVRHWLHGGRRGLLALALNAAQCRRRVRDRVWFFCSCVLSALYGKVG